LLLLRVVRSLVDVGSGGRGRRWATVLDLDFASACLAIARGDAEGCLNLAKVLHLLADLFGKQALAVLSVNSNGISGFILVIYLSGQACSLNRLVNQLWRDRRLLWPEERAWRSIWSLPPSLWCHLLVGHYIHLRGEILSDLPCLKLNIEVHLLEALGQLSLPLPALPASASGRLYGKLLGGLLAKCFFGASHLCLILVVRGVLGRVRILEVPVGSKGCQSGVDG